MAQRNTKDTKSFSPHREPEESSNRGKPASPSVTALLQAREDKRRRDASAKAAIRAILEAAGTAQRCTRHNFPFLFDPTLRGKHPAEWSALIDWSSYAKRWMLEGWGPAIKAIHEMESAVGAKFEPWLVHTARFHMSAAIDQPGVLIARRFLQVYRSGTDASSVQEVVDELVQILSARDLSIEESHGWFESLAISIEGPIPDPMRAATGTIDDLRSRCNTRWDPQSVPTPKPKRGRGRPRVGSAEQDRALAADYHARGHESPAEFARRRGLSESTVKKALDRSRKHERRAGRAPRPGAEQMPVKA